MSLTAVSLFAGIGGLLPDLALELAGIPVVAAVEIDPAARGVLADHFPDTTTLFNDVREVTGDQLRAAGFDPTRGLLAAGWPCQDISVAGRRLGLGGSRSGLFWEVVRLVECLRPRWLCLENVPGLLSAVCSCPGDAYCGGDECGDPHPLPGGVCGWDGERGRCMELHGGAMGAVVGSLAELGYGLCWRVLDAAHFGVPQRRRRIVFVGCLGDGAAPVEVLLEPEGGRRNPASRGPAGPGAAVVTALRAGGSRGSGPDDNDAQGGRLIIAPLQAQGSSGRGHRINAEGASGGHLVAATLTAGSHASNQPGRRREDDQDLVATALTTRAGSTFDDQQTGQLVPVAFDAAQITSRENRANPQHGDPAGTLAAGGQPHVAFALRSHHAGVGQGHNTTYVPVAHTLRAEGGDHLSGALTAGGGKPGQGYPAVALAAGGQPHVVGVGLHGETSYGGRVSATVTGSKPPGLVEATAVRRLTPVECERLQGLPDGWTATSNRVPQSDSARYRQIGNSVAVPVFEWVARRIAAVDAAREVGAS